MKAIKISTLALAAMAGSALAGGGGYAPAPAPAPQGPMSSAPLLFDAGWHVGGHALFLTPDADIQGDSWGGGVNIDYFFNPYVGFQASGAWADASVGDIVQNYVLDLTLRAPIESAYLAPYVFAGVGTIYQDDFDILGRAGVGIEFRPTSKFGIFVDWSYSFPGGGGGDEDFEDYQMIRGGVKFGF